MLPILVVVTEMTATVLTAQINFLRLCTMVVIQCEQETGRRIVTSNGDWFYVYLAQFLNKFQSVTSHTSLPAADFFLLNTMIGLTAFKSGQLVVSQRETFYTPH